MMEWEALSLTVVVILGILTVAVILLPPPGDELFLVPPMWAWARKNGLIPNVGNRN